MGGSSYGNRSQGSGRDVGPLYGDLLEDIRSAGMIETVTSIEVAPVAANEYLCVVRAECIMPPLGENRPPRRFVGLGAAYPKKAGANVIHGVSNPVYFIHTAESRAKKRAWQDALGRGDGLEEDVRGQIMDERSRVSAQTAVAAPPAVPAGPSNPDGIVTEEIAQRIARNSNNEVTVEDARQYTRAQAAQFFRAWNERNSTSQ